jgi:methyltransferase (TIGR00027 family)
MAQPAASKSARNVALARAHLTAYGVIDDTYALQMLPPEARRVATVLRLPGLRHMARVSTMPGLAARTLFFDEFIGDALDRGLRQVVIVAAGYDSRGWRLARPGVTFFEVDRPATQADKRTRAPDGGPVYVAADVTDPGLDERLTDAGLVRREPAAFTMEGLVVYLEEADVRTLFAAIGDIAAPGSRLAVSFDSGFQRQHLTRRLMTAHYGRAGETLHFRTRPEEAPALLATAGWTVERLLTASDAEREYLGGTKLARRLNTTSFWVVATKSK